MRNHPTGVDIISKERFAAWHRHNFPKKHPGFYELAHKISHTDSKGRNRFEQIHALMVDMAYHHVEHGDTPEEALEGVLTEKRAKWSLKKPTGLIKNNNLQNFVAAFFAFYKQEHDKVALKMHEQNKEKSKDTIDNLTASKGEEE